MSTEYVRRCYGVDFKRGDRVTVNDRPGVVVSFPGQYVGVRFRRATTHEPLPPDWAAHSRQPAATRRMGNE